MCLWLPVCLAYRACFRLAERIWGLVFFLEPVALYPPSAVRKKGWPQVLQWRLYRASLVAWQWRGRGAKKLGGGNVSVILASKAFFCPNLPHFLVISGIS